MEKTFKCDLIMIVIQRVLWLLAIISSLLLVAIFNRTFSLPLDLNLIHTPLHGIGFGVRFDSISAILLCMVTILAASIARYSDRYLNGEKRQPHFYLYLAFTTFSVSLLILSNNLAMLFLMWLSTSYGLHQLLTYYPERPLAILAARKKFFISRLGDVALLLAIVLTDRLFGTLDLDTLFKSINLVKIDHQTALNLIGVFFAIGAMAKSAQFPFHFWLPETMETPTPVSAFMHAGIINAGGFLMIRLSPLMVTSGVAQLLLATMGAFTASFGALAMITQNDIKKKLAYSTISQMGMMMFACGLGLYSIALFHIVAHSFYKSHAFLSTGFLVNESKKVKFTPRGANGYFLALETMVGFAILAIGLFVFDQSYLSYFTYAAVLWLGLAQSLHFSASNSKIGFRFFIQVTAALIFAFVICVSFEFGIHQSISVSDLFQIAKPIQNGFKISSCIFSYFLFVFGFYLSSALMECKSNFLKKLYLYFWSGGYLSQYWSSFGLGFANRSKKSIVGKNGTGLNADEAIEKSLKMIAPSWPLQNIVAVNPFWFLRKETFEYSLKNLASIFDSSAYMPIRYYAEKVKEGKIDRQSLSHALNEHSARLTLDAFLEKLEGYEESLEPPVKTFSQFLEAKYHFLVNAQVGAYCAAYFDDRQALARFPWQETPFWKAWCEAQRYDQSMATVRVRGFSETLQELRELSPRHAIEHMLSRLRIVEFDQQVFYMQKLIASVLGWGSQFKYMEWQRSLGHSVDRNASAIDLLAVRMAYDYGLAMSDACTSEDLDKWVESINRCVPLTRQGSDSERMRLHSVLQLAAEYSYQKVLSNKLSSGKNALHHINHEVKAQMVFCIDVRSEPLRRNIETQAPWIKTKGFAGFFGAPFSYQSIQETKPSQLYPVLLKPAFRVGEIASVSQQKKIDSKLSINQVFNYFRNLRKSPFSSFLYVELFGALYIERMLRMSLKSLFRKSKEVKLPKRFNSLTTELAMKPLEGKGLSQVLITEKIDRAEFALKHMGLTDGFAQMIFFVGHGSETTNNAFGSSLECGACGGHSGDVNARFLSQLLNEGETRAGLAARGISIPEDTLFIPAVHETVTDVIYILDEQNISESRKQALTAMRESFSSASERTRVERQQLRSIVPAPSPKRRGANWSETRPEWGLAGNASFIVAPRERTAGMDLEGRSFLHDYNWEKDRLTQYQTLELIMTAPMIVTNWINLQYLASVTLPRIYGSGNKTLHNLINESGVVEGNGGDLRIGLPFQSVHDGEKFVHEPLRLSVLIEAPRVEIEKIISKHEVVRDLVNNGWIHLLQIEPGSGNVLRRMNSEKYVSVNHFVESQGISHESAI